MAKKQRALTGIRSSGNLHIGNYFGAIREGLKLQDEYECFFFIADMHSLTTTKNPDVLRTSALDVLAHWLALGLDTKKHILYRQSDLPMVAEYAWYLSCSTGMGFLQKAHAYKDALAKEQEVNHGTFAYPVLMAADILMYDADVVPVGKDQVQHVEMARDIGGSVNARYGDGIIHLPEVRVNEDVMTIPGLDGRKMSKSYDNVIPIFCPEKELRRLLLSLVTDSSDLQAPKQLDGTLVGLLFQLFASTEQYHDLKSRLAAGGFGWGHAKLEVFEVINAHLAPAREKYFEMRPDEEFLKSVLNDGAERAFAVAEPILNRLRQAVGMRRFAYDIAMQKA